MPASVCWRGLCVFVVGVKGHPLIVAGSGCKFLSFLKIPLDIPEKAEYILYNKPKRKAVSG